MSSHLICRTMFAGMVLGLGAVAGLARAERPTDPNLVSLMEAIYEGDMPKVRKLLAAGVSPDGEPDCRPLFQAAIDADTEAVHILLAAGANPNVRDPNGNDALHYCDESGWLKVVLGRPVTQMEKDVSLVHAEIQFYVNRMIQHKSCSPHWGQGLIGYWKGHAYFWSQNSATPRDADGVVRTAMKAVELLRKHGAGSRKDSPLWAAVTDRSPGRIERKFGRGDLVYAATVWGHGGQKQLVCLTDAFAPIERTHCFVFDQSLRVVSVGECSRHSTQRYVYTMRGIPMHRPYALVEYRSSIEKLPANMRGRWMPALAELGYKRSIDANHPIGLFTRAEMGRAFMRPPAGRAFVVPIDFYGAPVDLRAFDGGLEDLDDIEFRFAEAEHPFHRGVLRPSEPPEPRADQPSSTQPSGAQEAPNGSAAATQPVSRARGADAAGDDRFTEQIRTRDVRLYRSVRSELFIIAMPDGMQSLIDWNPQRNTNLFSGTLWATPTKAAGPLTRGVVWHRKQGNRVVFGDIRPGFPLGTAGVMAFDPNGKMAAVGEYATNRDNPRSIGLAEFRSADPRLPKTVRGRWMLAVAQVCPGVKLDPNRPLAYGLWPRPVSYKTPDKSPAPPDSNRIQIRPIDWYNDDVDFRALDFPFGDLKDSEIRPVATVPLIRSAR